MFNFQGNSHTTYVSLNQLTITTCTQSSSTLQETFWCATTRDTLQVIIITLVHTNLTQVIIAIRKVNFDDLENSHVVSFTISLLCHCTYGQFGSTNDDEDALVNPRNAQRITGNLIFYQWRLCWNTNISKSWESSILKYCISIAIFSCKGSKNVKNDFRLMFIRDSSNSLGFMILSDFIWTMFHSSWISIVIIQIIYIGKVDTEVIRKSRTRSNADAVVRTVSAVPFDTEVIRFRGRNCLRRRHQVIIRHI